jgi:hypothetical protein
MKIRVHRGRRMLDDLPLEAMTVGYETCSGLFADRLTKSPLPI